jgi:hypothetical protein
MFELKYSLINLRNNYNYKVFAQKYLLYFLHDHGLELNARGIIIGIIFDTSFSLLSFIFVPISWLCPIFIDAMNMVIIITLRGVYFC